MASTRFNFDLHQVLGTVTLPLLFVITLTGILIPYQSQTERVLRLLLRQGQPEARERVTVEEYAGPPPAGELE